MRCGAVRCGATLTPMPTAKRTKLSPARGRRVTLEWWNYDLWGNARDGYDVNDRSASGDTVTLYEDDDDKTIFARMRAAGMIDKGVKTTSIEIDGELPWGLNFRSANGKPLGELSAPASYRKGMPDTDKDGWDRVRLPVVKNPSRRKRPVAHR